MASATVSGLRPVATTLWPAASAALAMSAPMPRPAPVINQVFVSVMSEVLRSRRSQGPGRCRGEAVASGAVSLLNHGFTPGERPG